MSFSVQEKIGIIDLLQINRQNTPILFQLAKSVTKNLVDISTEEDALNIIFLHIPDSLTLLNKRLVTKTILLNYLHKNTVPLEAELTKIQLASKIISYWNENKSADVADINSTKCNKTNNTYAAGDGDNSTLANSPNFSINLLARKFCEWFFDNYNKDNFKLDDFWPDASLILQITANDGIEEQFCDNSDSLLESLQEIRKNFGFYFNPNLTHAGVQGRMEVHGLVLVLSCGTLHTGKQCVGVFECVFGLLRDPFSENHWKPKNIKLILRSKGTPHMPMLKESDTFREALELPVPQGELP